MNVRVSSAMDYTAGSLFADWDVNVDGAMDDDPWDFGAMMQYPTLKWDGMSVVAQSSLAMGMPNRNGDYPVVGQNAGVCLASGPAMRAGAVGSKEAWTDIPEDGGATCGCTATAADLNNCLAPASTCTLRRK